MPRLPFEIAPHAFIVREPPPDRMGPALRWTRSFVLGTAATVVIITPSLAATLTESVLALVAA